MSRIDIHTGHCLDVLKNLEAGSIQTCVTSPPYWGLRDYGTPPVHFPELSFSPMPGLPPLCKVPEWEGHLGLEADPADFVGHIVAIFREIRRVLKDDGTAWVNFGDSYTRDSRKGWKNGYGEGYTEAQAIRRGSSDGQVRRGDTPAARMGAEALKPKDLAGIPWRVAFALQADGWYLRSDVIWHKPNPMPESVWDRPTKAHEYIFLLSKSERYFYDAEAIMEKCSPDTHARVARNATAKGSTRANGGTRADRPMKAMMRPQGVTPKSAPEDEKYTKANARFHSNMTGEVTERNKRTVWSIPTQGYKGAHFATYPRDIPRICILAGSRPGDTVLDPFGGSGTTGEVATELARNAVLIELGEANAQLCRERTNTTLGLALT